MKKFTDTFNIVSHKLKAQLPAKTTSGDTLEPSTSTPQASSGSSELLSKFSKSTYEQTKSWLKKLGKKDEISPLPSPSSNSISSESSLNILGDSQEHSNLLAVAVVKQLIELFSQNHALSDINNSINIVTCFHNLATEHPEVITIQMFEAICKHPQITNEMVCNFLINSNCTSHWEIPTLEEQLNKQILLDTAPKIIAQIKANIAQRYQQAKEFARAKEIIITICENTDILPLYGFNPRALLESSNYDTFYQYIETPVLSSNWDSNELITTLHSVKDTSEKQTLGLCYLTYSHLRNKFDQNQLYSLEEVTGIESTHFMQKTT